MKYTDDDDYCGMLFCCCWEKKYFKVVHEKSKIRKAMIKVNIRASFEGDFQI